MQSFEISKKGTLRRRKLTGLHYMNDLNDLRTSEFRRIGVRQSKPQQGECVMSSRRFFLSLAAMAAIGVFQGSSATANAAEKDIVTTAVEAG